jgi:transcriptional regulator NrdR family protein
MGRFTCTECSEPTQVIETRLQHFRIKRRRCCPNGHRFNTLEIPADAYKRLKKLVKWFEPNLDEDGISYAYSEIDAIILGIEEK